MEEPVSTPIHADSPQIGYYRYRRNRDAPWEACAIWQDQDGKLVCSIGAKASRRPADAHSIWTFVADKKVSKEDFFVAYNTGKWPADPPPAPVIKAPPPSEEKPTGTDAGGPPPRKVGPGDNSGDLSGFEAMVKDGIANVTRVGDLLSASPVFRMRKAELEADVTEAKAYFAKNPLASKNDADKCENWRDRIFKASKALDAVREAEKAPFLAITREIDGRYGPVVRAAEAQSVAMKRTVDAWDAADMARRQKAAAEEAKRKLEAAAAAMAAETKALVDQGWPQEVADGLNLASPAEPVVAAVEKNLYGTGSKRRSARTEKPTAVITNLAAAAAYYAEQAHPDLVALIQKLADKAAGANAKVPGCVMSWEKPTQQAAE